MRRDEDRAGVKLSWYNTCLACMKPWTWSPAPLKHSVVVHTYNPSNPEGVAGRSEFKVILPYK